MTDLEETFLIALTIELFKNLPNWYGQDNWDDEVLPYRESLRDRLFTLLRQINKVLYKDAALIKEADIEQALEAHSSLGHSLSGLAFLYHHLQDDYSRSLLIVLIAHRKMGYRKVKLPLNTSEYWVMRKFARTLTKSQNKIKLKFRDFVLQHMELSKIGFPLEIFYNSGGVAVTFILKQYEYQKRTPGIKAQAGDYVIDAGGCWGDTALYFAQIVGAQGKVYTFEFEADNLDVLHRNLALNSEHAKRVEIIPRALWNRSGEEITYALNGPATSLKKDSHGTLRVPSLSIDDFVKEQGLPRLDFIKMDIEGAELKALRGAEQTLRTFRPRLAISLYHKDEDFVEIPQYLESLNLGYKFYLDHFTVYRSETILFADPQAN